jgi:hypothetical protein
MKFPCVDMYDSSRISIDNRLLTWTSFVLFFLEIQLCKHKNSGKNPSTWHLSDGQNCVTYHKTVLSKNPTISQIIKKFPALYATRIFIAALSYFMQFSIKSRADSRVKVYIFPDVSGTDSVHVFRVLLKTRYLVVQKNEVSTSLLNPGRTQVSVYSGQQDI